MDLLCEEIDVLGVKFSVEHEGEEVARAYLYVLKNDINRRPFGFLEDVFVDDAYRGKSYGSRLVDKVIEEARQRGCYKLVCTSRHPRKNIHEWYERKGFKERGLEFRLDF